MKTIARLFLLGILLQFAANMRAADLCPERLDDYGSGPTGMSGLYYPGGIPNLGLAVGHPNSLARNDRMVVKFNMASFLPSQQPVESATLHFSVTLFAARENLKQQTLTVGHLNYTMGESLAGTDLVNRDTEPVGSVPVNSADIKPGPSGSYSVDVTNVVNADIQKGRKFCGFRFGNALTEEGNPDARSLCVYVGKNLCLKIRPRTAVAAENKECLDLVKDGKPQSVIIIDKQAPDSVRHAARELQEHVAKASGATLPIQDSMENLAPQTIGIYLGETKMAKTLGVEFAKLKSDAFRIIAKDHVLVIAGRDYRGSPVFGLRNPWQINEVYNSKMKIGAFGEAGTLNGVYHFLEQYCGVRWYMPGDLGTVIPRQLTIHVPSLDETIAPDYEYRYPWLCNFEDSPEDALWYRRLRFGAPCPVQIIHSFGSLEKYKDQHPEYFALIGGARDFGGRSCLGGGANICLSNPAVADQWVKEICQYFDQHPEQKYYPLAPEDGMVKVCECPQCQAQIVPSMGDTGKFSDYVWRFVNTVAKGVAAKHPDRYVGCLAYESYLEPPSRITKLEPNVAIILCKARGAFTNSEYQKRIYSSVKQWTQRTHNIFFWEYYLYTWLPWREMPVAYPHLISQDLRMLAEFGKGEFIESESWGSNGGVPESMRGRMCFPATQHLNLYVTAKALWNTKVDVDNVLDEYYAQFYGPAAAEMKAFWTTAESLWMSAKPVAGSLGTDDNPSDRYKPSDIQNLCKILNDGLAKAEDGSLPARRIRLVQSETQRAFKRINNLLDRKRSEYTMPKIGRSIKLGGVVDQLPWNRMDPISFVGKSGEAAPYSTLAYGAWSSTDLYLTFVNFEPVAMRHIQAKATVRDQNANPGMWEDDSVEMFLCPDPDKPAHCYHFIVSASGALWDGEMQGAYGPGDSQWNSRAEVKTVRESNRWIAQIRIPLQDLGLSDAKVGRSLAANFYRNRYCGQPVSYMAWSPSLEPSHFCPKDFGLLHFGGDIPKGK
jgi:hypothetical protein